MITPMRVLTKKEQRELRKKVLEMVPDGLIKAFLEQGLSLETAKSLTETILSEAEEAE